MASILPLKLLNTVGSVFFNYKGFFSIVLLALVDADYKFTFVDVGSNGRISDGGVLRESYLQAALDTNSLGIPPATMILLQMRISTQGKPNETLPS